TAVEAHICPAELDICQEAPHGVHPPLDVEITGLLAPPRLQVPTRQGVPGLLGLDSPCKRECLPTHLTREQPAAATPRTVELRGIGDQRILAVAVRDEGVRLLRKIDVLCHRPVR